jgi:hypothetical protein
MACLCFCQTAHAEDAGPFQFESGHWMSFDRYNDNIRRHRPVGGEALDKAPVTIELPALGGATGKDGEKPAEPSAAAAAEAAPSSTPVMAAPTRPLDLPILPGVNKGFGLQVDSTADDDAASPAQIVTRNDGATDIHLQQRDWKNTAEIVRQYDLAAASRLIDMPAMPGVNKGYGIQADSMADDAASPAQIVTRNDGATDIHLQPQNWKGTAEIVRQHDMAAPTRPIDVPTMPGVNKGYGTQADSTADNTTSPAQIMIRDDGTTDIHLQLQNWQDAAEIARQHADEKNGVNADSEHMPLNVRMSFLPNAKVTPAPGPERKPRPRLTAAPPPKPAPDEQKSPAECAAIDAYKKKQLEAIQSDRQTLQALQSAIIELGLQKELNFMAGAAQSPTLNPALGAQGKAAPSVGAATAGAGTAAGTTTGLP